MMPKLANGEKRAVSICGWDCIFKTCTGPVIVRGDVKGEDSLGLGHVEAHAEECPQCSNEASLKRKVFRVCVLYITIWSIL